MPGDAAFGLGAVMAALREEVSRTSIRAVADELGMSPSGLHVLLQGSKPRAATRRKVVEWFGERRARSSGARARVPEEDVDAAVALLERYIAADGRKVVRTQRVREITSKLFGKADDSK